MTYKSEEVFLVINFGGNRHIWIGVSSRMEDMRKLAEIYLHFEDFTLESP